MSKLTFARLPPSYNSLKASSTYRLLEANLAAGVFDRELFLRYLQLPRSSPIVHPDWARRPIQKANLSDDFMDMALLPPIGDEQPLVRTYLEHFLEGCGESQMHSASICSRVPAPRLRRDQIAVRRRREEQWYKMLIALAATSDSRCDPNCDWRRRTNDVTAATSRPS